MYGLLTQRASGERGLVDALQRMPLELFSGLVGWVARRRLPRPVRQPLYGAFARVYQVDLGEAELPLADYPSFADFFARRLRNGLRPIEGADEVVVSPCDGALGSCGVADGDALIQAKGRNYSLAELLADDDLAETLAGGTYLTFYLSPRDYHRVHSPISGSLRGYTWVPGKHLPVMPRFVRQVEGLFARNERIVLELDTEIGPVAVVMVAAAGVANISITAAGVDSRCFRRGGRIERVRFPEPIEVRRGDELGAFHLGSTVVAVFPAGSLELTPAAADRLGEAGGLTIRLGQPVAAPAAMTGARAGGSRQ